MDYKLIFVLILVFFSIHVQAQERKEIILMPEVTPYQHGENNFFINIKNLLEKKKIDHILIEKIEPHGFFEGVFTPQDLNSLNIYKKQGQNIIDISLNYNQIYSNSCQNKLSNDISKIFFKEKKDLLNLRYKLSFYYNKKEIINFYLDDTLENGYFAYEPNQYEYDQKNHVNDLSYQDRFDYNITSLKDFLSNLIECSKYN